MRKQGYPEWVAIKTLAGVDIGVSSVQRTMNVCAVEQAFDNEAQEALVEFLKRGG